MSSPANPRPQHHILSVLVENRPGVLARVASLFARRGFNIFSLAVAPTEDERLSRLTIVVDRQNPSASEKLLPARIVVGAGDSIDGTSVFYVRRDRVDASWAVAQAKIRPLIEALSPR